MSLNFKSLSYRYLLSFTLLIIVPVFLYNVIVNIGYSKFQRDLTKTQIQYTVNQMSANLNNEIASVTILSSALVHNENFRLVCDSFDAAADPLEIFNLSEQMDLELSNLFLYTNKVGIIYIYTRHKPVFLFRNFPLISAVPIEPIPDQHLIDSINSYPGFIKISNDFFSIYKKRDIESQSQEPLLVLGLTPGDITDSDSIEKILFAYKIKVFDQIYNSESPDQLYFISDTSGNIILESHNIQVGEKLLKPDKAGKHEIPGWLLLSSPIKDTDWILYHAINLKSILKPFNRIQRFSFLVFSILYVFFIIYTVFFFRSLISPLNLLIDKMKVVESGDYSISVPEPNQKELNHLFHSFNSMIKRIGELTELQSNIDKEKGLLELQALQYQINPHFIANTLNAIRLMAVVKKNENIKNMTASLMNLINNSFRGQGSIHTLKDEVPVLTSYTHIMKVRFSIPLELRFSIPPELEHYPILKMLFQPIVENAIVHGFADKTEKGIILIQAILSTEKDIVIIRIVDNGCGIDIPKEGFPQKSHLKDSDGLTRVGIENVDRRIKLNYGENYGLSMKSRPGFYTLMEIQLPIIKGDEL